MGRKRKFERQERKFLKKAGFGREFRDMGALVCALEEAKAAPRVAGYALQADSSWGERTRRRVRRVRWNRQWRCVRRMLRLTLGVVLLLVGVLLLVAGVYEFFTSVY